MIYLPQCRADILRYLCLVTVIKNDEAKNKKGLIDYNCHVFQDALNQVLAQGWNGDKAPPNGAGASQNGDSSAQDLLRAQVDS